MAETKDMNALPDYLKLFAALAADPKGMGEQTAVSEVDPHIYLDPERLVRERATLFRNHPVIVAHESELTEPGTVLAHDHLGVPILLMRDRDGVIRAFLNACRHRNTKLVKEGPCEKRASIVCPYHSWTYGLDGALLNIPCEEQFPGVEKATRGLAALPCEVRHGLVWVTPRLDGEVDLNQQLGSIGEDLDAFGFGEAVVFRKVERVKKTNWKLVVDAFQDGYHIQYLHRHSIAPFFTDCCSLNERVGRNIRAIVAREPFIEASKLPSSQWDIREHATYSHYIFPNTVLVMHPDYASIIGLFPLSTGETMYVHTMLVPHAPRDDKERDHYERSFDLIENGVFQAEDLEVCERAQAAMEGGAHWPMTLGAYEGGVKMFHEIVDEALALS